MDTRTQILTELQEIAPHLGSQGIFQVPYAVPAGYFADFTEILMNRIRFETVGLGEPATAISSGDEISEISPLLASLKNKNTYQVPTGYFQSLNPKIPVPQNIPSKLAAISGSNRTKKISVPMRIVRFAAAACIVGLIGVVSFNLTHRLKIDPINSLTGISDQDMANFLDAADVHWTPDNSSASETASADFNDNEIHELLSGVPDVELEQYSQALPEEKRAVN
jgi:hypothetical protein